MDGKKLCHGKILLDLLDLVYSKGDAVYMLAHLNASESLYTSERDPRHKCANLNMRFGLVYSLFIRNFCRV